MSVNDSMKKTDTQEAEVLTINGEDLYLDKDGNVIRRERKNKKKLFTDANKKLHDKMSQQEMEQAQMLAAMQQRQND